MDISPETSIPAALTAAPLTVKLLIFFPAFTSSTDIAFKIGLASLPCNLLPLVSPVLPDNLN